MGGGSISQLVAPGRKLPWTGCPSSAGPLTATATATLPQTGTMDMPITQPSHLWHVGGDQSTRRKATQTWGEYATHGFQGVLPTGSGPCGESGFFLTNIITKQL